MSTSCNPFVGTSCCRSSCRVLAQILAAVLLDRSCLHIHIDSSVKEISKSVDIWLSYEYMNVRGWNVFFLHYFVLLSLTWVCIKLLSWHRCSNCCGEDSRLFTSECQSARLLKKLWKAQRSVGITTSTPGNRSIVNNTGKNIVQFWSGRAKACCWMQMLRSSSGSSCRIFSPVY